MIRWLACAVLLAVASATAAAHPAATTTVSLTIDASRHYVATVTADAAPLIAKLEALSAEPLPDADGGSTVGLAARIEGLRVVLLDQIAVEFDGRPARPAILSVEVSDSGQATVRLFGWAPADAEIATWSASFVFGSYPVSFRGVGGTETVVWLQGPDRSAPLRIHGANQSSVAGALWLGFTHILPQGIDHILFVAGLFLLSPRLPQVFAQVTAFTLAHSLTLGLSLYGVVSLPAGIVEPLIALSVAYVGVENLATSTLHPWRVVVVFAFGLLHGLGFADALAGLDLTHTELLSTLVSFNVGVEAGQLSVIGIAAAGLALLTRTHAHWRRPLAMLASGAIGITGVCWTIQRLF